MNTPHLRPALVALLLGVTLVAGGRWYAERREAAAVCALAPDLFPIKNLGSALQREAFRHADLLPIYGSSELDSTDPFRTSALLADEPTGFTIFPVGQMGTRALVILQKLAAVGSDLRDRKVVVSFTPPTFYRGRIGPETYAGNFSRLHASGLAFSGELSRDLKHAAAQAMLGYPETLTNEPLTRFALEKLASDSAGDRILYVLSWPLGKLQNLVYGLQDHWATLEFLRDLPVPASLPLERRPIEWPALLESATESYKNHSDSNPFGFNNRYWDNEGAKLLRRTPPQPFGALPPLVRAIRNSPHTLPTAKEWENLDLLLRALQEWGTRPLVMSSPAAGRFYDYWGVSFTSRKVYYNKLTATASGRKIPLLDFKTHDGDADFVTDPASHLSSRGWVYYTQALNAFYHANQSEDFERSVNAFDATSGQPVRASLAAAGSLPAWHVPADQTRQAPRPGEPRYEGTLDRADSHLIAGWAWDPSEPTARLQVDVFDGDRLLTTVEASRYREGLARAGKGDGKHAFMLATPAALKDGRAHSVRVTVSGTPTQLHMSPRTLGPGG